MFDLRQLLVRVLAVVLFASCPAVADVAEQVKLLDHVEFMVRTKAAEALGKSGSRRAVGPLLVRLGAEKSPLVRATIVAALGTLRAKTAVAQLQKLLSDGDYQIQEAAVQALGMIGDRRAFVALKQLVTSSASVQLKIKGIEALRQLKDRRVASVLVGLMGSANHHIRLVVVRSSAFVPGGALTGPLVARLKTDRHEMVRVAAAASLTKRADPRAIPAILDAVTSAGSLKHKAQLERYAKKILKALTGEDFDKDWAKWRTFWDENKRKLIRRARKRH